MRLVHKVATALLLFLAFMGNGRAAQPEYAPGELLVGYAPSQMSAQEVSLHASWVGSMSGFDGRLGIAKVKVSSGMSLEAAASQLRMNPSIQFVEPNYTLHALAPVANDPLLTGGQYAPTLTQATAAWGIYQPKALVVIAIVDTGVQWNHPDLINRIYRQGDKIVGYDIANRDGDPMDDHGHGTHCAGIAAAEANNGIGVAGMAGYSPAGSPFGARIMPVKVLKGDGSGSTSDVADGITWAADHGANIISMSLGSSQNSETLNRAVQYAWSKGCVITAAAGNSGDSSKFYPAAEPHVIAVASSDSDDGLSSYSNFGTWVTVAAPGSSILSTALVSDYAWMSGTSMASPCVAGEAALVWAQAPGLSNQQVVDLIRNNTDPLTSGPSPLGNGAGRINALRAVSNANANEPSTVTTIQSGGEVIGGNPVLITIGLSKGAMAGGSVINLVSSNASIQVPSSVTVAAGQQAITISASTSTVGNVRTGEIKASSGNHSVTIQQSVVPLRPIALQLPNETPSKSLFTVRVLLNGSISSRSSTLWLRSDSVALSVPTSVQVAPGKNFVEFTSRPRRVTKAQSTRITASLNGGYVTGQIVLKP